MTTYTCECGAEFAPPGGRGRAPVQCEPCLIRRYRSRVGTCADCGGQTANRAARCWLCRGPARIQHGTDAGYSRGCKCAPCRAAHVARQLEYVERYRAKHGVTPSTAYRREHGYGKVYWVSASTRLGVYERDGYVCQLCNEPTDPGAAPNDNRFPSLDHIVPQSRGGDHTPDNLRTAHRLCNARRGNRD